MLPPSHLHGAVRHEGGVIGISVAGGAVDLTCLERVLHQTVNQPQVQATTYDGPKARMYADWFCVIRFRPFVLLYIRTLLSS